MIASDMPPSMALRRMTTAYWTSEVIHVVAELGVPDVLASGPTSSEALAEATGAHPSSLDRLLRASASLGIMERDDERRFRLTPRGELLRSDVAGSMRAWAVMLSEPWYRRGWDNLLHSVRTGEPAFDEAHGAGLWDYLVRDRDAAGLFNAAMTSVSSMKARAVLDAYDFSECGTVVDVGGGHGTLVAAILRANPAARGILFDLPHVAEGATSVLRRAGVADRCRVVGGDFFAEVPGGGDAYVLATVIHDWADEPAAAILRTCRRAMSDGAKLLLVEQVIPSGDGYHPSKFDDLNMLVTCGGREREAEEFRALFGAADFRLTRIVPTESQWSVIEGVPS